MNQARTGQVIAKTKSQVYEATYYTPLLDQNSSPEVWPMPGRHFSSLHVTLGISRALIDGRHQVFWPAGIVDIWIVSSASKWAL